MPREPQASRLDWYTLAVTIIAQMCVAAGVYAAIRADLARLSVLTELHEKRLDNLEQRKP